MNEFEIRQGDALTVLREMPDESVNCCVTSPPYFGLRDYGTAKWEGGEFDCGHSVGGQVQDSKAPGAITTGQRPGVDASHCRKCGAIRVDSQVGLESTPEAFVERLVEIFREVRRVLKSDGTLWVNIGDSYASKYACDRRSVIGNGSPDMDRKRPNRLTGDLKEKDLIGIPWLLAFALRADGWYLRQEIIWAKPNPMPESVTDRCTKSHEQIFLLSKSSKYFYDADAIREPNSSLEQHEHNQRYAKVYSISDTKAEFKQPGNVNNKGIHSRPGKEGRNKRSVWNVTTVGFKDAHFATFPPKLIEPCILAGCPRGGTVLDPFAGSGTTGLVSLRHGRKFIGVELNPEYCEMARNRITNDAPLFNENVA